LHIRTMSKELSNKFREEIIALHKQGKGYKKDSNSDALSIITELEATAHEERTKIPLERCQKLVSGYASRLQQVKTAKGCSISTEDACHEGVESF